MSEDHHPYPPVQYPRQGPRPPFEHPPQGPPARYPPQGYVHPPRAPRPGRPVQARGGKKHSFWRRFGVVLAAVTAVAGAGGGVWAAYEAHSANEHPRRSTGEITSWTGPGCQGVGQQEHPFLAGIADLIPGETLWEVTIPSENPVAFVGGRIDVGNDGRWQATLGPIGADQDAGKKFALMIVAAPPSLQRTLQDAFENGEPISPAPTATDRPLAQICAVRTD